MTTKTTAAPTPTQPPVEKRYEHFIGGRWTAPTSGRYLPAVDPSTGQPFSEIADGTSEDVAAATDAAATAFEGWRNSTPGERAALLLAIADRIEEHADRLAGLEALDAGKPVRQVRKWDLPVCVDSFRFFAAAVRQQGDRASEPGRGTLQIILREPVGPVAQIIPWNGVMFMLGWKVAPALAAGCSVVLKPSEKASVPALEFARIVEDLIPPGLVNVVTGGPAVGTALCTSPRVRRISFTGSSAIGRDVMAAAARNLVPVSLELGGKSPNVVLPDADLDAAVAGALLALVPNQGQMCTAGSRLLLHRSIADEFVARLQDQVKGLRIGPALSQDADLGPVITGEQRERIQSFEDSALSEGARAAFRLEVPSDVAESGGFFVPVTGFRDMHADMRLAREEVFGPTLAIFEWESEDELLRIANAVDYGLAMGVWGRDINAILRVVKGVPAGVAWVNNYGVLPAGAPFGGFNESGFGRENAQETIDEYQGRKTVLINLRKRPLPLY